MKRLLKKLKIYYLSLFNKEDSSLPPYERLTEKEKEIISNYLSNYEKVAKCKALLVGFTRLEIDEEIQKKLEKKYKIKEKLPALREELHKSLLKILREVLFCKKGMDDYINNYVKNKYGVDISAEDDPRYNYDYPLNNARKVIQRKVYDEVLDILEPYVPEDKRDKVEEERERDKRGYCIYEFV